MIKQVVLGSPSGLFFANPRAGRQAAWCVKGSWPGWLRPDCLIRFGTIGYLDM